MTEREFEKMIREHTGTIYTVCYMFSTDNEEVADLFQEILINLWRGSGTFRGDSALNTWIWKVSLNTCISFDRKKKHGLKTEPLSLDIDLYEDRDEETRQIGLLRDRIGVSAPSTGPSSSSGWRISPMRRSDRSSASRPRMSPYDLSESRNNSKRCSNHGKQG